MEDETAYWCECNAGYQADPATETCKPVAPGTTPPKITGPGGGAIVTPPKDKSPEISAPSDNTWLYLSAGGLLLAGSLYYYSKRKSKKLF
jgi:LPXTG-motif cell wall-anchored protein